MHLPPARKRIKSLTDTRRRQKWLALSAVLVVLGAVAPPGAEPPASAEVATDSALSERWVRHGFAEARALGTADADHDGADEVVYGGRGVALVDERTLTTGQPRWSFKWDDVPGNVLTGGDNMWTTGLEMVEGTGDGIDDVLLTSSDRAAYLLDGATGEKVWRSPTGGGLSSGFALVDADDDDVPDMFPTGSSTVLSGRTGEKLWEAPIPGNARLVGSGYFDSDDKRDVILVINPPGAGTNPNTIVPAVTATTVFVVSSKGELLYDFKPLNGIPAVAAADVDGDGVDEAVLGNFNGFLHVLGQNGIRWSGFLGPSAITALQVTDADGDGRDEIIAGTGQGAVGLSSLFEVVAFGPEGAQRWRQVVSDPVTSLQLAQLDYDQPLELLVGGGATGSAPFGSALALETGLVEPTRQRWRVETGEQVNDFAVLDGPRGKTVAIGSADALLQVVDASTGGERGRWMAGGYSETVTASDLDGDGRDETIKGDAAGQVIVMDADGEERWSRKVPDGNNMTVFQVATGDVDGDGIEEVAAVAEVRDRDQAGRVILYSSAGDELWTRPLLGYGQDVVFEDLDGDGDDDLIVAEGGRALGDPCAIGGYDGRTGERSWWKDLSTCIVIHTDVADVDDDGQPEIGFGTQVLFGSPQAALLEADGTVVWHLQPPQGSAWVDLEPGTFMHGGFADQARGHLTKRDVATGQIVWQSFLPGEGDNGGSANRFGEVIPDVNDDGIADVVTSSDSREILLVDGGSGGTIWATRVQPAAVPVTHAHQSGPLTLVTPQGLPPLIFAAQYSIGRQRSETFVLSLAGEILDSFWMEGDAHAAVPARFSTHVWGVVVAAGLGIYAYQIEAPESEERIATVLTTTVDGNGANRRLSVRLSTADGEPVDGRTVGLSANGEPIGSVVTRTDGAAEFALPPRFRGGSHTFEAVFEGDAAYGGSSAMTSTGAHVEPGAGG